MTTKAEQEAEVGGEDMAAVAAVTEKVVEKLQVEQAKAKGLRVFPRTSLQAAGAAVAASLLALPKRVAVEVAGSA